MKRAGMMVAAFVALTGVVAVANDDWADYKDDKYGFEMKMPEHTKYEEKEAKDGWGFLHAKHGDVEFFAIAKLGTEAKAEEIEKVGVKVSEIPAKHWKEIDHGKDHNGWKWFKTVEASDGKHLIFGGYGTGPKGSYLLFLKTTEADYAAHKAHYKTWYESIKLH